MGWNYFLYKRDQEVFAASGYEPRAGFGRRPVVLLKDVTSNFCGGSPEPVVESIERWRNSCGEDAWEAIPPPRALIDRAHRRGVPAIYTTGMDYRPDGLDVGRWAEKNRRFAETTAGADGDERRPQGTEIIATLREWHIVVAKAKPSAFFSTLLASHLTSLQSDALIVCQTMTSGCVQTTIVDAFSYNYRVSVVEEATFGDRASHHIALFDSDCRYAGVVPLSEVLNHLDDLPADLFVDQFSVLAPSTLQVPEQAAVQDLRTSPGPQS